MSDNEDARIENLSSIREVFVDGYRGVYTNNGVVKVNFFSNRFDPESGKVLKLSSIVLSTSLVDLAQMVIGLNAALKEFEDRGIFSMQQVEAEMKSQEES